MAVFNHTCGGYKIKINNVDHPPPHCHITGGGNIRVSLLTLEPLDPNQEIPPGVKKCLRECQEEMIQAWDKVQQKP